MNRAFLAVAVAALVGCASSPPPRYYTLNMEPSGGATVPCNIDVERLRPSEPLSRKEILIKTSPTEIEYYASHQWAANLGELVKEKLESEFGQDLDDRKTIVISGTILAFEQIDVPGGAEVHIKLEVEFRPEGAGRHEAPLAEKRYEIRARTQTTRPGDVVKALSHGLGQIAAEIADDVGRL